MTDRTPKPKPDYGLLIHTKDDDTTRFGLEPSMTINLTAVKLIEGRKLRNPSSVDSDVLEGFAIRGYVFQKYAHVTADAAFFDTYKVERRDAKRMLKVYDAIERGTRRLNETVGYATTFGQQVARIANALGIKHIIRTAESWGTNYDEGRYVFLTIGEGVGALDRLIAEWRDKHPVPTKEEVTTRKEVTT